MEKRLIDANVLLEKLEKFANPMPNKSGYEFLRGIATAITEIEDAPTVDAMEVVHGHWCWEGQFKACSQCGSYVEWNETLGASFWKFCPYCGAKMDGVKECLD